MSAGVKYTKDQQRLSVSGKLSIRDAEEFSRILLDARSAEAPLTMDVSDIDSVDIAILQVLIAASKQDAGTPNAISLFAPDGGVLHDVIRRAGLEHAFPHLRS